MALVPGALRSGSAHELLGLLRPSESWVRPFRAQRHGNTSFCVGPPPEVLSGYEATCFAYGQTGTGKTYTMEGDLSDEASRGLVPRAAMAMIDRLTSGGYADWAVCCQYLEIYNEDL